MCATSSSSADEGLGFGFGFLAAGFRLQGRHHRLWFRVRGLAWEYGFSLGLGFRVRVWLRSKGLA